MAGEYDFMLPEDRALKEVEFETKRQAWSSIRIRGMVRFVLFHELIRTLVFVLGWSVLPVVYRHASVALALQVTGFVLIMQMTFNSVKWHWNERRFREKAS